jgi:hypothetical protein
MTNTNNQNWYSKFTDPEADSRLAGISIDPERSLPCSHKPATSSGPKPHTSNECPRLYLCKIYFNIHLLHSLGLGRAIAQMVSRRPDAAVAWVRSQVTSCGICGGQSGVWGGFLRVFRFPLPILIPPTASHSSTIIWGWYNRPVSGRCTKWTVSPHPKKLKKKNLA